MDRRPASTAARRMFRAVALVTVFAFACTSSAGCMRTTWIPRSEIPRLRPLMQGEPPGTTSVVLHGDYPIRVTADSQMDLVIVHQGAEMRATVTPARLAWRTDGLWVDEEALLLTSIRGFELRTFSLGRTIALVAACAGGLIVTGFVAMFFLYPRA